MLMTRTLANALKLSVNYDDGFIAWINGVKVAEKNAPANPAFDLVAPVAHEANLSNLGEVFPVAASSLRNGYNVLAIQIFNHGKDDPTLHFDAALIDTRELSVHASRRSFIGPRARVWPWMERNLRFGTLLKCPPICRSG